MKCARPTQSCCGGKHTGGTRVRARTATARLPFTATQGPAEGTAQVHHFANQHDGCPGRSPFLILIL